MSAESFQVEVVYALPVEQVIVKVRVQPGATLESAIRSSGILERYPVINLEQCRVGVFGRVRQLNELVYGGERIEIYRPLQIDPMERRRRRAASRRQSG